MLGTRPTPWATLRLGGESPGQQFVSEARPEASGGGACGILQGTGSWGRGCALSLCEAETTVTHNLCIPTNGHRLRSLFIQ